MFRHDPLANPEPLIRRVYAYAAYRVGDGADAEDVTGETFERALRYKSSFDPAKGEPISWLIGIARRCISEVLVERSLAAEAATEPVAPGNVEDETLRRLELAGALACLDERDRELIALRYGADLAAKSIAELLDLRTNAVEVALHRALARLRKALEEDHGEVRSPARFPLVEPAL